MVTRSLLNPRLDWVRFFKTYHRPHVISLTLTPFETMSSGALKTEARLLAVIRRQDLGGHFALRRIAAAGPARIECAFVVESDADAIARLVGAEKASPSSGLATMRSATLSGDACRKISRMGDSVSRRFTIDNPRRRTVSISQRLGVSPQDVA